MTKLRNNLDEMQEQNLLNIEKTGFWIAYWGLVIAIVVQALIYEENAFAYIRGEVIILFVSGICMTLECIRKGIWSRSIPATPQANLLCSFVAAGAFSLILGVIKYIQYGSLPGAFASAVIFFISMFILCFVLLSGLLFFYKRKKEKLEAEDEE